MAKTKKKCVRGSTKTVVVGLLTPQARAFIKSKGGKGTRSLLKKHLSITTCTAKDGTKLVKHAGLTEARVTPGGGVRAKAQPKQRGERRPKGFSRKGWHLYNQPGGSDYHARMPSRPMPPPKFELPPFIELPPFTD